MRAQEEIKTFFQFISDRNQEIDKLPDKFRRILQLALLDTLSKCAFPNIEGSGVRFVSFIDCYSNWIYKDYISLIQLKHLLEKSDFTELINKVEKHLSKWHYGRILRPEEADLKCDEFLNFRNSSCRALIEKARYANLLWAMRNFAIHEFRAPGSGWAISKDNSTPYYHGVTSLPKKIDSWELYISPIVISDIIFNCLKN